MNFRLIFLNLFALSATIVFQDFKANAQNDCENMGFQNGNALGWEILEHDYKWANPDDRALCCTTPADGINLDIPTVNNGGGPTEERHSIYTVNAVDPIIGVNTFPPDLPGYPPGNRSIRIGNARAGLLLSPFGEFPPDMDLFADAVYRTFNITLDNAIFAYQFAFAMNDPGHGNDNDPFFQVHLYDENDEVIPCTRLYISSDDDRFTVISDGFEQIRYTDWLPVFVDLTDYIGQQVRAEFEVYDCRPGAHFGYAYLSAYCSPFTPLRDTTICPGDSIVLTSPFPEIGFDILWSTGDTSESITVSPTQTTTYQLTVVNKPGFPGAEQCTKEYEATITVDPSCGAFNLTLTGDTICEGETGNLTATATGGDGDYTFTWNGGGLTNATGPNQTDNPAITTTYNVTVTDGGGNSSEETVDIVVNPLPTIVAETDTTMCIGESHTISASGGETYIWDNGLGDGTSHTVSPTVTTTYTVTGTDVNGCENTDDVTVTINPLPVVTSNDVRLCKNEIATLTATGASDYSWTSLDDGVILTDPNNASIDVETGQPGATTAVRACFEVQGVDANGCEDTTIACVDFEANCGPIVTALGDTICEGEIGNLTATATAGDGNYTFTWNGGNLTNTTGATQTDNPMTTTNYTVIVRDGAGNSDTTTVSIVVNPLPGINAGADDTTCLGTPVTITATGGTTYSWDNGLGDGASHSVNPTTQTTYTVTGQDENGCENTDAVTIYIDEVFPEAGPDQSICAGDQAQLNASGGGTYDWSPKDGTLNQTDISNPVATPTVSTTYSVRVTSAWGYCTGTDEVTVSIGNLSIDAGPDDTICLGASAQLQVIGGASYDWAPKDGSLSQTDVSNPLASPTVTTMYIVTAQNASGTCEATDTVRVHVETLTMGISPDDTICNGFGTQIMAIGGGTYDWSPKDGTLNQTDIANPTASPTVTTTYNVHITTPSGICEGDTFVTVVVDELVAVADPDFFLCVGSSGMLGVNAPGGISYQWTPATNLDDATSATPTVSATQDVSQLYTVTVTNANGCTDSDEQLVTVGDIIVTATAASPICLGTSSQLNATGGMNYSWMPTTNLSNSQIADPLFTPTETGTYNFDVIATDGGGNCPDTTSVTVIVDAAYADAGADTIICIGETTTLNGGEGVRYSWSPSTFLSDSTVSNPEVSPTAGPITYTLTVYSEYGCMASDEVVVDISEVTVDAGIDPGLILEGEEVSLQATTNGSFISWTDLGTEDTIFSGPLAGNEVIRLLPAESTVYEVVSWNDLGCEDRSTVSVIVLPPIRIPNVFTPNDDGINDSWEITNIENYVNAEIKVINRWGNEVFKYKGIYEGTFDGNNSRGAPLPVGTYYFEVELNFRDLRYGGDVTILR